MKITIIGNCGSGKTTLAQKISQCHKIPHLQLDRLWFENGGHTFKRDDSDGRAGVREKIRLGVECFLEKNTDWVSEGWYSRVQPLIAEQADIIVFLDIPLWRRLINHVRRVFRTNRHPEITRWEDMKFTYQIIKRTFTHGKDMREFVKTYRSKSIILKNYREVDQYLNDLSPQRVQ